MNIHLIFSTYGHISQYIFYKDRCFYYFKGLIIVHATENANLIYMHKLFHKHLASKISEYVTSQAIPGAQYFLKFLECPK